MPLREHANGICYDAGIYTITNTITGEQYVGKSTAVAERLRTHRAAMRAGRHSNPLLNEACRKHGIKAFKFEQIEDVEYVDLEARENYWFAELKPAYNVTPCGGNPGKRIGVFVPWDVYQAFSTLRARDRAKVVEEALRAHPEIKRLLSR